jgi:LysW-gamma-L-alpha-aminoadipyl-6-phosphate/LysW-L-glutamyl-5-phosphate reductase
MTRIYTITLIGASGYTGMEFVRFVQMHPRFELKQLIADRSAGQTFEHLYPAFAGVMDLQLDKISEMEVPTSDFVVLALPHGQSAKVVKQLLDRGYAGKIVDLGSDLRLKSIEEYQKWYSGALEYPELSKKAAYGLTEWNRETISGATLIANPGCFASAIQLGMYPLLKVGIQGPIHCTGITGSTGSGASASETTHYSTRDGNLKAYKVMKHQHQGEIRQFSQDLGFGVPDLAFTPVSGPFTRGIWITLAVHVGQDITSATIRETFVSSYSESKLVRLRDGLPQLKHVTGSAFTDIGFELHNGHLVVGVAIDNLGKGAASQAIQNMNLMVGLPDHEGLLTAGIVL